MPNQNFRVRIDDDANQAVAIAVRLDGVPVVVVRTNESGTADFTIDEELLRGGRFLTAHAGESAGTVPVSSSIDASVPTDFHLTPTNVTSGIESVSFDGTHRLVAPSTEIPTQRRYEGLVSPVDGPTRSMIGPPHVRDARARLDTPPDTADVMALMAPS